MRTIALAFEAASLGAVLPALRGGSLEELRVHCHAHLRVMRHEAAAQQAAGADRAKCERPWANLIEGSDTAMADFEKFPSFNFFPRDWILGTAELSVEQQGAFVNLLCYAWEQSPPCTLPNDETVLAKWAGVGLHRWRKIGPVIVGKMEIVEGRLRNPKQWSVYLEMCEHRERRRRAGEQGNKVRWGKVAMGSQGDRNEGRKRGRKTIAKTSLPAPDDGDKAKALSPWSVRACDIWLKRFGGTAPGGKIGKALKPLVDRCGEDEVLARFQLYVTNKDPEYASPADFAEKYANWSNAPPKNGKQPQQFDYSNATEEFKGFGS